MARKKTEDGGTATMPPPPSASLEASLETDLSLPPEETGNASPGDILDAFLHIAQKHTDMSLLRIERGLPVNRATRLPHVDERNQQVVEIRLVMRTR